MKKVNRAEFMRTWGLDPRKVTLRYKNPLEKGVYWYYVSQLVRQRDVEQYGTCISCGKTITFETSQAGHFMPARSCGRDLMFDLRNLNAECSHCNAWDETHLLGYADELDRRYGNGTAVELRRRYKEYNDGPPVKDWKGHEYADKIRALPNYAQPPHDVVEG